MSIEQGHGPVVTDPELAHVIVTGNCGHNFPVPIARLANGQEFVCPVCSAVDRFDDDAREAAMEAIAKLKDSGQLNEVGVLAEQVFSRSTSS